MPFYIELPFDGPNGDGGRFFTGSFPCVIEATPGITVAHGLEVLHIIAPPEIAQKWTTIHYNSAQWLEVQGPARPLTRAERDQLIHRSIP